MNDPLFTVSDEVVVLSGASGQLGSQYACAFLDRGAKVMGLDLEAGPSSAALSKRFGDTFRLAICDVTSRTDLEDALRLTRNQFGEPTVLINNAAIDSPPEAPAAESGPFETYPDESWDRVMAVNVRGVYLACQVFGGAMAEVGRGSIINVSSIYGVVSPDQSIYEYRRRRGEVFFKPVAYAVSKSALLNLTRYLAVYWAAKGVRVNTLVIAGVERQQDPEFIKAYCGRIPVGRMAGETEYNGAVLFLASRASAYMTGAQLTIDGGWTAI
jgi:NAD(P)-dependent dehydrogenase (short-subunit alcohol dehydrogenase family)